MWNGSVEAQQQADEAFKLARKRHQQKERLKAQAKKPKRVDYYAYIRSTKWKKFRDKVFKFRGHKCEECGVSHQLELHHTSYARLGRERFKDVKILCHNCHSTTHEDKGAFSDLAQEFFDIVQ